MLYSLVFLFTANATASDKPVVTITYYHYPPHIRVLEDRPTGKYVNQLTAIANSAGYRVRWLASSIDEEAFLLDEGRRPICTTGRTFTPERAERWAFLPYVFDIIPGHIVVTRPELLDRVKNHSRTLMLVQDSSLIGALLVSGLYGQDVDKFLRTNPRWIVRTGKSDFQLMNMVLVGRTHYAIVSRGQWTEAKRELPGAETLVDVPHFGTYPDYPIYIACSAAISPDMLKALSGAMAKHGFTPASLPSGPTHQRP